VRECALGADAVFFAGLAALERTQAAEFTLDGNAYGMRHLAYSLCYVDIVFVARRRLGVLAQRAVHHDAGEA
jgi:hypothetical protein